MRKVASIFFICMGSAMLLICSSDHLMNRIIAKRSNLKGWFGIHHSNAGDLVSMSYLDNVKRFRESYDYLFVRPANDTGRRNIDLYIYGDSYLDQIPDTAFAYINSYHFARRSYNDLTYSLDPNKKNILIIEYAERFARGEFRNFDIYNHVKKKQPEGGFLKLSTDPVIYAKLLGLEIFGKEINRNLEFNLFGYRFWDEVKLTKASLNYYLFRRAVGDAVVSDDGNRLFLRQTIAPDDLLSSYYPFDQNELDQMIANINAVYNHYKADGFDEVYLSIIPNPVTILQPVHYNGLIPQLQKQGVLNGAPLIDIYSLYTRERDPGSLYRIGDTHWSNYGMQVWLKVVNAELKRENQQADQKPR